MQDVQVGFVVIYLSSYGLQVWREESGGRGGNLVDSHYILHILFIVEKDYRGPKRKPIYDGQ